MSLVGQENELVQGGRAAMHDGIPVIGRDHDHLVIGQHFFEVAYFGQPARPFGHFGQSMQLAGFGRLEGSPVPEGRVLAQVEGTLIFVLVGSGRHQGSCAAEIVLVGDLDTTVFALDHIDEGVGPEFTTARAARWAHVGQVHHEGIVYRKVLVGVQEAVAGGGRQAFVALQLASTVPFVAVRGRRAGGALKV